TVVGAGDHEGNALALARVPHAVVHPEAGRHGGKPRLELLDVRALELDPHEEAAALGVGRVLIRLDDVGARLGEAARHGGDDAALIGTGDDQAGDRRHGDRGHSTARISRSNVSTWATITARARSASPEAIALSTSTCSCTRA